MPYAEGRVMHDADAHIMETPTWLRDHAEQRFRARAARPRLRRAATSSARPGAPKSSSATCWRRSTGCGTGTPQTNTGPSRTSRS